MPPQISFQTFSATAAENYECYFVPAIGAPLAADLVELAALRPCERVLDVACGTGVVARHALERVGDRGRVVGTDINAGMLAVARAVVVAQLDEEGRVPLQREVVAAWQPFSEDGTLILQVGVTTASARR
jgi:SAM-dependent methyltransferase